MVRAKFRLMSYETTIYERSVRKADDSGWEQDAQGRYVTKREELRTLKFSPVGDNSAENRQFWDATPTGELKLGTVNPEAWKHFELGKDYYLDFTPA